MTIFLTYYLIYNIIDEKARIGVSSSSYKLPANQIIEGDMVVGKSNDKIHFERIVYKDGSVRYRAMNMSEQQLGYFDKIYDMDENRNIKVHAASNFLPDCKVAWITREGFSLLTTIK